MKKLLSKVRFLLSISIPRAFVYLIFTHSGYLALYQEQISYTKFFDGRFMLGMWLAAVVIALPLEAVFDLMYYEHCEKSSKKSITKISLTSPKQQIIKKYLKSFFSLTFLRFYIRTFLTFFMEVIVLGFGIPFSLKLATPEAISLKMAEAVYLIAVNVMVWSLFLAIKRYVEEDTLIYLDDLDFDADGNHESLLYFDFKPTTYRLNLEQLPSE